MTFLTDKQKLLPQDALTPRLYFRELFDSFKMASSSSEINEFFYKIDRFHICLKFAGKALIPYIVKALSHLETSNTSQVDLTIFLWDSKSTGDQSLKIPVSIMEHSEEGLVFADEDIRIIYQLGEHTLNAFDKKSNCGLFWVNDVDELPFWIKGAPLRIILYLWLQTKGMQLVHAACVGKNGRGILIAGKGGSGKSTTAISCLLSGFDYLGDDYVAMGLNPSPFALSLYCSGKLNRDNIKRFSETFKNAFVRFENSAEKALVFLNEMHDLKKTLKLPLKAILIPKITNKKDSNIFPASPMSAMMALAPSTICQMPYAKQEVLTYFKSVVESIPSFNLELGTDMDGITGLIEKFILET